MATLYANGQQAACYLAVVRVVERAQAGRSGCDVGVLRLVVAVAALRGDGATVYGRDVALAGLGEATHVRLAMARALALGLLARAGRVGPVTVTPAGRRLVVEMGRAWERAAGALRGFGRVVPYPGQRPR